MPSQDYVIPYVDQDQPIECNSCKLLNIVGLRFMQMRLGRPLVKGFVCLPCIARMWNKEDTGPIEPTADERASGVPIIDTEGNNADES